MTIIFQTEPQQYRHWRLEVSGEISNLYMDVDEQGGLFQGYDLKLNSYDLGVDIELYDVLQRLRFGHPGVKVVILGTGKEKVFCAGANIRMLAGSSHMHKVNFCKFTNETRNAMEDASKYSGLKFIAAVSGACAGGGYELALACDQILLIDDGSSSIALPEVPLLGVLPGTGGLTRVLDKRKVRPDRADILSCTEEGIKGSKAREWRLVDDVVVASEFNSRLAEMAIELGNSSDRPGIGKGIELVPLSKNLSESEISYSSVRLSIDRETRIARITIMGPEQIAPEHPDQILEEGCNYWGIQFARELDDAILHLRFNEPEIGLIEFRIDGDTEKSISHDRFLKSHDSNWLVREILLNWGRVLRRIDLTSRSLVALVEPGSCYVGMLAEVAFSCDRIFMAEGEFEEFPGQIAEIILTEQNFQTHPMANGLTRLETRFLGDPAKQDSLQKVIGKPLNAGLANELGLVTTIYDDIDWYDEIRIFEEERLSFSPDALTGMEANLRFGGPETMETKIFGRLTAWQNWIFQRPNAAGEQGALNRYGTGQKPMFDKERI